ncbi:MAG: SusC/RagA family TonB-linked outer membrane protein [Flavobacteriaceae bacterium]|nr:SusC/RagA family TonB-linked outer membrane protein [Flavobacteriaceae bacterium]
MRRRLLPYFIGLSLKKGSFLLFLILVGIQTSYAQKIVTGKVTDDNGLPLSGATIINTTSQTGVISDFDGQFQIQANEEDEIVFSYIGFEDRVILSPFGENIVVQLIPSTGLDEVVITALGIERSEKALGYSVQNIQAQQLSKIKSSNIVSAISGKVSGVSIRSSSAGPTASANITIRGTSSLVGNNQPLFVVNGMPITNDLYNFDNGLNGSTTIDFGNAAQIINADDIQQISILKGPAASALYGSRAANGVILVETKTGHIKSRGLGVEINTSVTMSTPLKLPRYQNTYGYGGGGKYSYKDGSTFIGADDNYDAYAENWGPEMNGQNVIQFNSDGQPVPFTAAPKNIRNFYEDALTHVTNLSINNMTEDSQSRFSYTHMGNQGILPNTSLQRNTFQASVGKLLFNEKLDVQFNSMFVRSFSDNIPNSGYDESSSVMYVWLWFPRQTEIADMRDYWQIGKEGIQQQYIENLWGNNPYFIMHENTNAFQSNRLISNVQLTYDFNQFANLRIHYGVDYLDEQRQFRRAPSTKVVLNGSYREDEISFIERNAEFLFNFNPTPERDNKFDVDLRIGGNLMHQTALTGIANNPELQIFGTEDSVYTLTNSRSGVLVESKRSASKINSLFGLFSVDYDDWAYLDLTYRNDWASSLVSPILGNEESRFSYGYPSVSSSLVLSEVLPLPYAISFLKLRASYAEVGNAAPPYSFQSTFTPQSPYGSSPVFSTSRLIPDPEVKNETTTATELGIDLRLLDGQLNLDLTYYKMNSFNQIITLPVGKSSGYDYYLTNGGEISNKGFEISLESNIGYTKYFQWTQVINFSRNRAIVESLPDVIKSGQYSIVADVFPNDPGSSDLEYVAQRGELLGQLVGLGFQRGPDGQIIHEKGLPLLTSEKVSAGSYQPDFLLGLYNQFRYKNIELGFLIDGQVGGRVYSRQHALLATSGSIINNDDPNLPLSTLEGRTAYSVSYPDGSSKPTYTLVQEGGVVAPGLMYDQAGNLVPNTVQVPAGGASYAGYFYNYYGNGFNRDNIEASTYDSTFFKLREVSLTFELKSELINAWGMQSASVSLIGRNLFLFTSVPTIDPEVYSIRNGIFVNGYESNSIPSTRSFGINLNLSF